METDDPEVGFFSVTSKCSNKTQLELELGDFDCKTEELEFSPTEKQKSPNRKFESKS